MKILLEKWPQSSSVGWPRTLAIWIPGRVACFLEVCSWLWGRQVPSAGCLPELLLCSHIQGWQELPVLPAISTHLCLRLHHLLVPRLLGCKTVKRIWTKFPGVKFHLWNLLTVSPRDPLFCLDSPSPKKGCNG
jgi:hypothetical protein